MVSDYLSSVNLLFPESFRFPGNLQRRKRERPGTPRPIASGAQCGTSATLNDPTLLHGCQLKSVLYSQFSQFPSNFLSQIFSPAPLLRQDLSRRHTLHVCPLTLLGDSHSTYLFYFLGAISGLKKNEAGSGGLAHPTPRRSHMRTDSPSVTPGEGPSVTKPRVRVSSPCAPSPLGLAKRRSRVHHYCSCGTVPLP